MANQAQWESRPLAAQKLTIRLGVKVGTKPTMRIQFASQCFHASQSMPFGRLIKPVAPTLFLLGNTVNAWTLGGREFLRVAANSFDNVLLVPGPAEYAANQNECWRMNLRRLVDETTRYKNNNYLVPEGGAVRSRNNCGRDTMGPTQWLQLQVPP